MRVFVFRPAKKRPFSADKQLSNEGGVGKCLTMAGLALLIGWVQRHSCLACHQQPRPTFDTSKGFANDSIMATDKNDSETFVKDILATMAHRASVDTLLEFCLILAKHLNIQEIEGMPPVDWFQKRKLEKMENVMIKLEDKDPALAARFQRAIDEARKG